MNLRWLSSATRTAAAGIVFAGLSFPQAPEPKGAGLEPGSIPAHWITGGPDCAEVPKWQVHAYNPDLYIIRESGCTNYEKPFLYLFFGKDRALLEDTGAGQTNVAEVVDGVIADWLKRNGENRFRWWWRIRTVTETIFRATRSLRTSPM